MTHAKYDVVIVGGGLMGCSTAYRLVKQDKTLSVAVVEMDPTYEKASSTLSLANVRTNFSLKENIQISQYTLEVIKTFEEDMQVDGDQPFIAWRPEGNLFLYDDAGVSTAKSSYQLQKSLDCDVEWLHPDDIKQQYPLYRLNGIVAGTFGSHDGYLDGYSFLSAYKSKSRSLGVKYITAEVTAVLSSGGSVQGVKLATGEALLTGIVVNCAGAWAHPDWLSAIVPVSTEGDSRELILRNLATVPMYVLEGSRDRNIWGIGGPQALRDIVAGFGYDLTYREFTDRAHEGFQDHYDDVIRWLDGRARQVYPREIIRVPHTAIMPIARRVHWIETDTRQALLRAKVVSASRINITDRWVRNIKLFLHDRRVNLDKPIEIWINGQKVFSQKVNRSFLTALEQARNLGDERRI